MWPVTVGQLTGIVQLTTEEEELIASYWGWHDIPSTMISIFCGLSHGIALSLWSINSSYSHFKDEETDAYRASGVLPSPHRAQCSWMQCARSTGCGSLSLGWASSCLCIRSWPPLTAVMTKNHPDGFHYLMKQNMKSSNEDLKVLNLFEDFRAK